MAQASLHISSSSARVYRTPGLLPNPFEKIWEAFVRMHQPLELGLDKLFPRARKMSFRKALEAYLKKRRAASALSFSMVLTSQSGFLNMPEGKRYIDSLSLQKILSIKAGSLSFKRAHFLSIFTNRRAVIFTGSGHSADEAQFMVDFWYKAWRQEQKKRSIAIKVLEKSYKTEDMGLQSFRCELKVKYAFKLTAH